MSALSKIFKTNENLEKSGIWLDYGENDDGDKMRVKIARAGGQNKKFSKALEYATRPYRAAIQNNSLPDNVAERIYLEVFVDTVLLGWENIPDDDGKIIPYERSAVIAQLKALPEWFQDIKEQAGNMSLFREEEREATLKNSGGS